MTFLLDTCGLFDKEYMGAITTYFLELRGWMSINSWWGENSYCNGLLLIRDPVSSGWSHTNHVWPLSEP